MRINGGDAADEAAPPLRALVVDDDLSIQHLLTAYFGQHNIVTISAHGRQDVIRQFAAEEPDVVILDLQLGREDGLDLLREIRSQSDVPVVIMTGHRREEIDHVVGLELGADDYVNKPFGLRELVARIRAVVRRREARFPLPGENERGRYRFGNWILDRRLRRLSGADGKPIGLTKGEYALLVAFLESPRRPLSREHLLQSTRVHEDVFDRSIDVQILRLRRKLEEDPSAPRIIQTERGVGYRFMLAVERI